MPTRQLAAIAVRRGAYFLKRNRSFRFIHIEWHRTVYSYWRADISFSIPCDLSTLNENYFVGMLCHRIARSI